MEDSCKGNAYSILWVTNWPEIQEHDYPLCAWLFSGLGARSLDAQFTHQMCGVVASYIVFGTQYRPGDITWFYSVYPENTETVHDSLYIVSKFQTTFTVVWCFFLIRLPSLMNFGNEFWYSNLHWSMTASFQILSHYLIVPLDRVLLQLKNCR